MVIVLTGLKFTRNLSFLRVLTDAQGIGRRTLRSSRWVLIVLPKGTLKKRSKKHKRNSKVILKDSMDKFCLFMVLLRAMVALDVPGENPAISPFPHSCKLAFAGVVLQNQLERLRTLVTINLTHFI